MCSNAYIELLQLVENVVSFLELLINYSKLIINLPRWPHYEFASGLFLLLMLGQCSLEGQEKLV